MFQFRRVLIHGQRIFVLAAGLFAITAVAEDRDTARAKGAGSRAPSSVEEVVAFINDEIRRAWDDNGIRPSEAADDTEWLRRVSLDIAGRIPTVAEVEAFVQRRDDDKRARTVERLLDDPGYVRHWTNTWTTLLLGRQTPPRTSREAMERFLSDAFARNRPWNEVVHELLTAEGHYEENGAVNFLLGQLAGDPSREDYTVEATARTTRLFLGMQVQCTQCHNHPFNGWRQVQFWEFDSFFRQMWRIDHRRQDPETGRPVYDYSELVWRNYSGPVYFERRSGVMEVAYPRYAERDVDPGPYTDRRREFARLLALEDPQHLLARAMVNRTWGQFLGYGFTRPVDDMGPHNPPSHPELLARLTQEFAASGYDLKQLIRWIAGSEAYQLTSRVEEDRLSSDQAPGEVPLFSHVAVKPLTAEQLYDSLLVATRVDATDVLSSDAVAEQRQQWMREYLLVVSGNGDDEPTTLHTTIAQALMMMNGALVQDAVSGGAGSTLHEVLTEGRLRTDGQRIRRLYLATLSRNPTRRESSAAQKLIATRTDKWTAYQDLLWALLNSNEFVLNH